MSTIIRRRNGWRVARLTGAVAVLLLLTAAAEAQAPFASLRASADVTTTLGPVTLADEDIVIDDLTGVPFVATLGALPATADVEAYHHEPNGDQLFAFDSSVMLPGGLIAEARDLVRYDGALYVLEFDGSAHGVPADAGIDAVTRSAAGDLVLSFDTALDVAEDEDLLRFDGAAFWPYFDGSAVATPVPSALDLDAVHRLSNDHLVMSFDGSGTFPGFGFADEDLLELDPATGTWSLAFDASAAATPWPASSDLDAVALPEPGGALQLATGLFLVSWLGSKRGRARRAEPRLRP